MAIFTIIVHVCPSFCGQLSFFSCLGHILCPFCEHPRHQNFTQHEPLPGNKTRLHYVHAAEICQ